ncbi:restriction endonuclease subunit S [Dickeya solani]|uniref:Restriction endonuclease subunit S n=1 Tax=Dickeya solani TaxID=1089444 RepID=A0ABU4EF37_9GAMM|nr:restriction endonuclease subunit S [Dickeya solani]MCA7001493.1 restriction endonuclease subunit S [Dickeya solani]MCZ0820864.1 restriction endonuclease subunit S [Dickeya solani]MDV6996868.1 restriction endonuclease subunit S [Dickeya solani]MDV7002660.1 restriction endonuclease subunit S [Dickeya solani]MDV7038690.1 restriction endonuclease subunit S [Dickeya solani]
MAKYKAYPEYKDSGVEWLGEIPRNWKTTSISRLFSRIKRTGYTEKELLSVYRDYGVIPKSSRDDNNNKPSEDLSPYQLVEPNDLVMNKMKAWQGSIAISEYEGIVSPAYFVYQPNKILFDQAYPRYVHYLLRNPIYVTQYLSRSKGIRVNQWDLDPDEFRNIELLFPSKYEQEKIYNFLDHETAKIDNLIEKQQQLIELLKEKLQAVISHAVTKGLNPDVPMKNSGVEWLGKIPGDWQLKQIRHLCTSSGGGTPSKSNPKFWVGNIPWVSPKDMKVQYISDAEDHVSEDAVKQSSTKKIPIGSVLIVVRGMILAHSVPVAINTKVVTINQDMKALVPNGNISCDYLHLVLIGLKRILLELTDNSAHGTKCLRTDLFEKMWVPLPSLQQQHTIVSEINEKVIKIDGLIHLQEEAKALLQERRTVLISAAVTGKIDVRDWVAPDSSEMANIEGSPEVNA